MTISRVHGLSDCSAGLPLPLLPVESTGFAEALRRSELVGKSGSSGNATDGGRESSYIRLTSLISANGEPEEEDEDDRPAMGESDDDHSDAVEEKPDMLPRRWQGREDSEEE